MALVVGRIVSAEQHPGARAPSYLLVVDLGGEGRRESTLPAGSYAADELEGRQVVCALAGDELTVLAAHARGRGLVLVAPDREVEDGTPVA
jgi:tRNA-binding EMAP/Myf-like protein